MEMERLQLDGLKAETSNEPGRICPVLWAIFTQIMEDRTERIIKVAREKFININRVT
jgi:hypothetical protein